MELFESLRDQLINEEDKKAIEKERKKQESKFLQPEIFNAEGPEKQVRKYTLDDFNKLREGMTKNEICSTIGEPTQTRQIMENGAETLAWVNFDGSYITVFVQINDDNNKIASVVAHEGLDVPVDE